MLDDRSPDSALPLIGCSTIVLVTASCWPAFLVTLLA
jgi:hypothetical protein